MGRTILVTAAVITVLGTPIGHAADIAFKDDSGTAGAHVVVSALTQSSAWLGSTLRLSGPLRQGDAEAMKRILVRLKSQVPKGGEGGALAIVEMSSLGGDLTEGLKLGYLFRDYNVATVVRRGDICLSACALAFLGGTSRQEGAERTISQRLEVGAKLGFHSFYLNPTSADAPTAGDPVTSRQQGFKEARAATASLVRYAADLGIDPKFVADMMAKPQEEMTYVNTAEEFLALKVCPIGIEPPAASLEEQALNICNHSTGWIGPASLGQVRRLPPEQAKRYMLENIQENMSSLKVKGALFEQLASYSVMRVEKSIDRLYADLRAAGVRLPEIMGPVFEVSDYRFASEQMQCFVSLAPEDPHRYAVAIRRPAKWSHPNWGPPRECRGLYRYAREAAINPGHRQRPELPVLSVRGTPDSTSPIGIGGAALR